MSSAPPDLTAPLDPTGLAHIRVVLVRPQQPGNIGTVARAIANHGLGRLVLVDPPGFDPERARWMAPEAHHIIDQARFVATVEDAVADIPVVIGTSARRRRWDWPVTTPEGLAPLLGGRPAALLFGPEDAGLSNADLERCHALVSIPTTEHRSLNLGQAVTVLAAALRASALPPPEAGPPLAGSATQEAVARRLLHALEGSDYLRGRSPEQVQGTLYRLIGRAQPTEREAVAVLGMLSKLVRRLRITAAEE